MCLLLLSLLDVSPVNYCNSLTICYSTHLLPSTVGERVSSDGRGRVEASSPAVHGWWWVETWERCGRHLCLQPVRQQPRQNTETRGPSATDVLSCCLYTWLLLRLCDDCSYVLNKYRVGQKKPDCFLKLCNSRICWRRVALYIPNCSVFYPE